MSSEVWATIPQDIEQILARIGDGFVTLDREWRYVYVNDKLAELAQMKKEDFLGRSIWELFPETINSQLYTELHRAVAEQVTVQFEYLDIKRHLLLEKRVYPSDNGVSILIRDITQYKRTKQFLAAQYAVTRILAEATTFANAISSILQSLCDSLGWQAGKIWNVNHNTLHCISSWYSSSLKIEDFQAFNQCTTFAVGEGLPGRVWASGEPVWIKELPGEPYAAIGFPMRLGNKILGVIQFFSQQIPEPDTDLLQMMNAIATQIAQFIEHKQTELLLRESEEKYRRIFDTAGVSIWEEDFTLVKNLIDDLTAQGVTDLREYLSDRPDLVQRAIDLVKVQDVNQHTLKMYGAQTKEELYASLNTVFVPETAQVFLEQIIALAEGRRYYESETILTTLQGEQRHILFTITFPEQTGYERVLVSILDISDRKAAEEILRRSEVRYRSLAEATASIVWTATPHGSIVEEIPTWGAFTGQSFEQYKGWGWVNALHPEDKTLMLAVWKQGFSNRSVASGEYRLRRHDGEYRYVAARGVPILDETGELCQWVGMCVDISDRKQTEAEREQLLVKLEREQTRLVAAKALLDTIINNAPVGIGIWDEELKYVRVNDALAEMNGLPKAAHIGKTVAELLPGVDAEVMAALRHVIETGESVIAETSGETPAAPGKKRYWLVNYYPIKLPSDITCVGAICQEITERKLAEAEREHLLEREQAARVEAEVAKEQVTNILESITDGFLAFDREWRFTYLNHQGTRTLGRSSEELLGKNLWEEFPELAETSFGQLYQRAGAEGVPLELEDYYPPFKAWFTVRAYPSPAGLTLYFRNINQRKQAEAALQENEAGFRLLAENSTDMISRQTVGGLMLYVSPACYTLLGYKPEELVGRFSSEFVHPDDLAEMTQNHPINTDLPDIYTITHRARHKDGHYIWLEATIRAIRNPHREILELQASSREITERKRVEQRQRFLAQASSILTASLDYETTLANLAHLVVPEIADWCVVDIIRENQSVRRVATTHSDPAKQKLVEQLQNYPPDLTLSGGIAEVIRSRKSLIRHEISQQQMQAATHNAEHLKVLQELAPKSWMCILLTIREQIIGAISLISACGHRYDTEDLVLAEELARRAAIAIDNAQLYTEAQRSQQAALSAAARTARLQAVTAALSQSLTSAQVAEVIVEQGMAALSASSALVAIVTESGTELEIVRAEGYQPELLDLWRKFSINAPVPLAQAIKTKEPIWQEPTATRITHYSNLAQEYTQYDYGSWISIPLIIEGRAVGGMSLAFTEIQNFNQHDHAFMLSLAQQCAQAMERARLYEAAQTAREAAETANRIKDEFLAVLSHELRSPLNPILGWSKLLQTKKLDEKTVPQALKTIERNAKLQAQLIEDLLDISRILQGKLSLNIHPIELTSVILAAMETVRLSAEAKSIAIHTNLEPIGQVLGDSGRLQQIIWNLLSNAVKFTPEGGWVEVQLSVVRRQETGGRSQDQSTTDNGQLTTTGKYAQITVSDTGKGIDPNFLPYVFDYFRQENSTSTRKFGGLGLGLAIVRHLVELHGGTVQAESLGENQGATFTARLPLIQNSSKMEQDSTESELSSDLNGVNILMVDDDADTREFIAFLLEQYGANVTAVTSADEALAALTQSLPDLLLSDIGMPEIDGCMLMRQIRTLPPEQGGELPAIALTAYAGEMNEKHVLKAGFHKHIAKPVEPEELVEVIANLLQ